MTDRHQPESDADGSDPVRLPSPAWVPTDDVMSLRGDKQVLVAGTTPTGLTLALLLGAAGFDPVLVSDGDPPVTSRLTYLSPAALEVLGTLDLGVRLHHYGRVIDGSTVRRTDGSGSTGRTDVVATGVPNPGRASPVVVPTPVLLRTLGDAVPATATVQDRAIGAVSRECGGVTVTFDDGVRESFDVVVGVGGRTRSLRPDRRDADGVFRQYEAVVDGAAEGHRVQDVWTPDAVVQRLPGVADAADLVRITTPVDGAGGRDARRALSELPWDPESGAFERRRVPQRRLPGGDLPGGWWGEGRIAYCGAAACPVSPAAGMGQSLGISDALALVSALTRDTSSSGAVGAYAAARARRLDELRRTVARSGSPMSTLRADDHPFGSLRALRAIALEPFFGTAPEPLETGVPG